MAKKKFVLRIDENTMSAVEKWAADEFRSVNGQLEWIISKAIKDAKRVKKTAKTVENKTDTLAMKNKKDSISDEK